MFKERHCKCSNSVPHLSYIQRCENTQLKRQLVRYHSRRVEGDKDPRYSHLAEGSGVHSSWAGSKGAHMRQRNGCTGTAVLVGFLLKICEIFRISRVALLDLIIRLGNKL